MKKQATYIFTPFQLHIHPIGRWTHGGIQPEKKFLQSRSISTVVSSPPYRGTYPPLSAFPPDAPRAWEAAGIDSVDV